MSSVPASFKYAALAALCLQNTALILSMRYSRSVLKDNYLDSTIVVMMELVKLVASICLVLRDGHTASHLINLVKSSGWIAIPSVLYVVQNTCQLTAVQNLDASTFSVLSQAKVLTTAICSVLVLRVNLSPRKWRALALLVLGCILVQFAPVACPATDLTASATAAATAKAAAAAAVAANASTSFGLLMTLIMVCISGVAGVTIERILKNQGAGMRSMSLWERNVQLSFWGVLFATLSLVVRDGPIVARDGFFHGWSTFAVVVVVCQSVGGLVTAVVVKYTNTIIKGFAVGLSVVMISLLSIFIFNMSMTLMFGLGAGAVLLSIFNFNEEDPKVDALPASSSPPTLTAMSSPLSSSGSDGKKHHHSLSTSSPSSPSSPGQDRDERASLLSGGGDRQDVEMGRNDGGKDSIGGNNSDNADSNQSIRSSTDHRTAGLRGVSPTRQQEFVERDTKQ